MRLPILVLICMTAACVRGQEWPIVRAVEPDYSSLACRPTFLAPIAVNVTIHPDGTPYRIASQDGGLEESVWRALVDYRFQRSVKGLETTLTIPVRRAIENYEIGEHFYFPPPLSAADEAVTLDTNSAKRLESRLPRGRSEENRAVLLIYSALHDDAWSRELKVRQLTWFLKNEPTHPVLETSVTLIRKAEDPDGFRKVKELWISLARSKRYNRSILRGLTNFLRVEEPEVVRDMLWPLAGQSLSAMEWYGEIYGLAILGIAKIDPLSGEATVSNRALTEAGFGAVARTLLLNETELPLLTSAFSTMRSAARSLNARGQFLGGYASYCEKLQAKIRSVNAAFRGECQISDPLSLSVPGDVMGGKVTKSRLPWCPWLAMEQDLDGSYTTAPVSFEASIGVDGKVKSLRPIRGRPELVELLRPSLFEWEFEPYTVNGKPIEVFTTLATYCRF